MLTAFKFIIDLLFISTKNITSEARGNPIRDNIILLFMGLPSGVRSVELSRRK